jgi:hypothetical protein
VRALRQQDADGESWRELLLRVPVAPGKLGLAARGLLLLFLALWTLVFLRHGMSAHYLMSSFMHVVNLVFHEAGHVLLMPFGRFLAVLGGSALQLLIPLLCGGVFLLKNRDPFAASVTLWWAGQSLMDLAPYIADARALRLPLLGGGTGAEVEGHDWEYLLGALGLMNQDVILGRLAFAAGALAVLAALGWGGTVLWRAARDPDQRARSRGSMPIPSSKDAPTAPTTAEARARPRLDRRR